MKIIMNIVQKITASIIMTFILVAPLAADNQKVRLAYFGEITDASLFAAIENGFFEDEGISAETVFVSQNEIVEKIFEGKLDGFHADYRIFAAREGFRLSAGLEAACIEIVAKSDSGLKNPSDLKGKTIAVENIGSGPSVAAARLLRSRKIDPSSEINWKDIALDFQEEALISGEADALVRWEGSVDSDNVKGQKLTVIYSNSATGQTEPTAKDTSPEKSAHSGHNMTGNDQGGHDMAGHNMGGNNQGGHDMAGHNMGSQDKPEQAESAPAANPHAHHTGFYHFYAGFVGLSENLVENDQKTAAGITKAWLRGAKWVGEHPKEATEILIKRGRINGTGDEVLKAVEKYMWMPGIRNAKDHIRVYIREQKAFGILPKELDEANLFKSIFAQLLPDLN